MRLLFIVLFGYFLVAALSNPVNLIFALMCLLFYKYGE